MKFEEVLNEVKGCIIQSPDILPPKKKRNHRKSTDSLSGGQGPGIGKTELTVYPLTKDEIKRKNKKGKS